MATVTLGPAVLDIAGVRAGDLNEFAMTLTANNKPVDLSGYTITAQARNNQADTELIAAVVTVVDAPKGMIKVRWPGDLIRTWLATKVRATGVWDMQLKPANGDPTTVVAGTFAADMDVTRP